MTDLVLAIGLVLALEGALYALMPGLMLKMLREAQALSPETLRLGGVASLAIGVLIVWLVR